MLAPLLRTTRQRRAWSTYDLAFRAGLDAKTIRDAEAGRIRPTRRTLAKLAAALCLPLAELEQAAAHDAAATEGRDG